LSSNIDGLAETITIREVSTTRQTTVPSDTIKNNFNNVPSKVEYVSRSVMVFQRIDNVDISIFSMYVQEYEEDCQPKRVYLAYLDSVEYFRPRKIRSSVYHEVVVSYFAFCKLRGFNQVHIWSCPPSRGNNFIFWGHPAAQKTPNRQRLQSWYQNMIHRCVETGVCYNVHSLCDEFESFGKLPSSELPPCPAILAGDYWLDEASRIWKQHEKRSQSNKGNVRKSNHIIEDKSIGESWWRE
jgi:E1A/CREB-binding protein